MFVVLRHALQAKERVRPIVVAIVLANLLNLGLDLVLVFGRLGLPAMGAFGSAWATTAARTLLLVGLLVVAWRDLVPLIVPFEREAFRLRPLRGRCGSERRSASSSSSSSERSG